MGRDCLGMKGKLTIYLYYPIIFKWTLVKASNLKY